VGAIARNHGVEPSRSAAREEDGPAHAVHFYEDQAFPDVSIADYLWSGLQAGESIVLLTIPDHAAALRGRLAARGAALAELERSGRLLERDAAETLDAFMIERRPDPELFREVVGNLVQAATAAAPSGRARVFGECVAVLADRHNLSASIALEHLWNELWAAGRFSLCCGYPIRPLSHGSLTEPFRQVCDTHDEIVPILTGIDPPGRHARCVAVLQQQAYALRAELDERRRTEERLTEALRREAAADRRKDELLAMLGHELRNPLAPILSAVELMELRGDPQGRREREVIRRQLLHMRRLVDDLLDVSRMIHGQIQLRKEALEISTVLAAAIEGTSALLEQRDHRLSTAVPRAGLTVHGDASRLCQVFSNLLSNAAKFTSPGGHITVAARRVEGEIVVEVSDTGCGIDEDLCAVVFDPFVQGDCPLDRAQGGLGLGLAMVKSLTELHGGSVSVHSEGPGRGSLFAVRLPSVHVAGATHDGEGDPAPAERRGPCVLVVDDNRDAADTLAEALRESGCEVMVAYDGPDGLARADERAPDVALLDVGLPMMDGYELARRLRARFAGRALRIVAMTGYGQDADRARSREAGFDLHLVKPVDLGTVLEAIRPTPDQAK
jgi:signal transduction histidine kinase/ActR/RegA family two-component response regulator